MNTVVLIYGIALVALGVIGYLQSGSATSFIGSAAGVIALLGGYLYLSQPWAKWLCFGAAAVVILGVGMRLPAAFAKIADGAPIGEYWVRLTLVGLSVLFAIYYFVGFKSSNTAS